MAMCLGREQILHKLLGLSVAVGLRLLEHTNSREDLMSELTRMYPEDGWMVVTEFAERMESHVGAVIIPAHTVWREDRDGEVARSTLAALQRTHALPQLSTRAPLAPR